MTDDGPDHHPSDRRGEMYALEDATYDRPALPGEVVRTRSVDELIDAIAANLVIHAENCVREFGDFHLALSGGSTPQPLYERLMYDPDYRRLPWRRTHLWIVDERRVPLDHEASNFRVIRETIADHADIPTEQVHPIFAMADDADEQYELSLKETLGWREKGQDRLDYVLLGMGADGHTASLFPGSAALNDSQRLVRSLIAPDATPAERITMTYPLLNASRFIAVMISGGGKAAMVDRIARGEESWHDMPIKGIQPHQGDLHWYVDDAACQVWDEHGAR